jgi:hypothetical protein
VNGCFKTWGCVWLIRETYSILDISFHDYLAFCNSRDHIKLHKEFKHDEIWYRILCYCIFKIETALCDCLWKMWLSKNQIYPFQNYIIIVYLHTIYSVHSCSICLDAKVYDRYARRFKSDYLKLYMISFVLSWAL